MTLCGPILLPSRAVAMGTFVLLASILSSVAVAGLPRKKFECGSTAPLSWWRRAFLAPVRLLLRLALFSMGYLYIEEEGKRAPLKESPIVVANHLGPIEPLILAVRTGGMPVSKIENMSLPFFGAVAKLFLPILVDRNDDNSRKAVAAEIESRARRAADGTFRGPVFLFPEGTTTNGTSVITFKAGAFAPRLPVQPVVVRFPHAPGHFAPIWTAVSPSLPELFFRMLCEPVNRCKISWLPVASPVGEEEKTGDWPGPKLYASRVQTIVADAMGGTTTRFAFEDVRLMNRAKQLVGKRSALATSGAAIEFKSMQEELVDLNLDDAMRYLQRFSEADRSGSGNLTLEEFEAAFGDRMSSETLRRVFDLLDDDRSGRLDFREFLVGASLLHASSEKMLEDALQFCFTVFDTKNEGKLDFRDAQRILRVVHSDVEEEALRKTFDSMDENGNGFLDKEEFVNWVKRNEETLPAIRELLFV
uniref:EF-hand domain-containing protein n=1 Tax=Odontella aurita TaxID=265563 RepID=A0A7S4N6S9_9STRA|mmetsp:Transcript_50124/g.150880  ORF Transcript_50124/g.150880 Transcript_50124/m.150880 type:complete len:475 (+) Transcript_50124:315-1739(+)